MATSFFLNETVWTIPNKEIAIHALGSLLPASYPLKQKYYHEFTMNLFKLK
jgi:hypothetical protein